MTLIIVKDKVAYADDVSFFTDDSNLNGYPVRRIHTQKLLEIKNEGGPVQAIVFRGHMTMPRKQSNVTDLIWASMYLLKHYTILTRDEHKEAIEMGDFAGEIIKTGLREISLHATHYFYDVGSVAVTLDLKKGGLALDSEGDFIVAGWGAVVSSLLYSDHSVEEVYQRVSRLSATVGPVKQVIPLGNIKPDHQEILKLARNLVQQLKA